MKEPNVTDLISIRTQSIGGEPVQTVNARDLHGFLDVGRDFSNWIRDQLARARLQNARDYVVFAQQGELVGGRPRVDYALTLDAAKHIAMLSQCDRGFEVREYFIECERRAKAGPLVPQTMAQALRLAADQAEQLEQQAQQLALAAPKVAFVERYVEADSGLKGFRQVAKLLKANENRFREFLTSQKIMYRLGGEWMAHQQHVDAGRFEVRTGEAHGHAFNRCLFTPKGVEWVAAQWAVHNVRAEAEV